MKKTMKKAMFMVVVCSLLFSVQFAGATTAAMKDIGSHWAQKSIEEAVSQGWINGYTDKTFRPNASMTRAEFLKSLIVAMDYQLVDEEIPFREQKNWYTTYMATGLKQSIIKFEEYEYGYFQPNRTISREEIAIMTVRALGKDADGTKRGYLAVAKENFIMNGYPDGSMGGEKNATRAEAVVMILNTLLAKNPPKVVTNPTTAKEYDAFVKSLPSFKGTTIVSSHQAGVLISIDGTGDTTTGNIGVYYDSDNKVTVLNVYEHSEASRAIVKDILKNYFTSSYEKAYSNYVEMIKLDTNDAKSMVSLTYDKRSFVSYKAADNKTVVIRVGV